VKTYRSNCKQEKPVQSHCAKRFATQRILHVADDGQHRGPGSCGYYGNSQKQ
jgi:hypothetical protein